MNFDWLARFYRRNISFDEAERRRFLMIVRTQIEAGLPLARVFSQMASYGHTEEVRKLCQRCVDQQPSRALYTASLGDEGHFSQVEASMLAIGEENEQLIEIIKVLTQEKRGSLNLWTRGILPARNPIVAALIGLGTLAGLAMYQDTLTALTNDTPAWVGYGEAIINFWHVTLMAIAGVCVLHWWLRSNLPEVPRLVAAKYGMFRITDRQFAVEALRLASVLNRLEASPSEILGVWDRAFKGNQWHRLMLRRVGHRIDEGNDIIGGMEHSILEQRYAQLLRSLAPLADSASLAVGYPVAIQLMESDLESMYRNCAYVLQAVGWLVGAWTIWQLIPFIMGTALTSPDFTPG